MDLYFLDFVPGLAQDSHPSDFSCDTVHTDQCGAVMMCNMMCDDSVSSELSDFTLGSSSDTSSEPSSYGFSVEEEEDEDATDQDIILRPMFRVPDACNDELDLKLYTELLQPAVSRKKCDTNTYDDSDISLHQCWSSDSEVDVPDYVLELDCPPSGPPSVISSESFTEEMIAYREDLAYEEIDGWANYHYAEMEWNHAVKCYMLSMEEGRRPYEDDFDPDDIFDYWKERARPRPLSPESLRRLQENPPQGAILMDCVDASEP